jgi:hypothetical protein
MVQPRGKRDSQFRFVVSIMTLVYMRTRNDEYGAVSVLSSVPRKSQEEVCAWDSGECRLGRSPGVERAKHKIVVPRTTTRIPYTQIFYIKGPINHSNDAVEPCAHSHLVPLFPSLSHHQILPFSVLLASLFIFSGIAAAGPPSSPRGYDKDHDMGYGDHDKCYGDIYAPECIVDPTDPSVSWVCTLSLPCILWPLSDSLSDLHDLRPRSVLGRSVHVVQVPQVL